MCRGVANEGKRRKLLFIEMNKAHLNPVCNQDVFELPEEANPQPSMIGKLIFWLNGFRPAAQAWENCNAAKFIDEANFERGVGSSVSFWQTSRGLACCPRIQLYMLWP